MKFLLTFLCLSFLVACGKKDSDHRTLVIGTSVDNPPFEFYQNGEMTGFDIELGKLIAKKLGRDVKFVDMSFDTLIAALQAKKVDIAMAALAPTEERAKSVDFSRPYNESHFALVTVGLTDIKDFKNLEGQTVGVQLGSTYEQYAKTILEKYVHAEVRSLGKVTDLIQELRIGRIAGLITGIAEADKIIEMNPSFTAVKLPEDSAGEAVALPKGSSLTEAINTILNHFEADGTLSNLRMKWKIS